MAEIFGNYALPKITSTFLHTLEYINKMILKSESLYVLALYVNGIALQAFIPSHAWAQASTNRSHEYHHENGVP